MWQSPPAGRGVSDRMDSTKHNRRSIRMYGYGYSRYGWYFVTVCTKDRASIFGVILDGEMRLNQLGEIVEKEWLWSSKIRQEIELDEFVIMPNHIHGIITITTVGANGRSPVREERPAPSKLMKTRSLSSFIAGFKSSVTVRINDLRNSPGAPVWRRNYYERIIRDDQESENIRAYICNNPTDWALDEENPLCQKT